MLGLALTFVLTTSVCDVVHRQNFVLQDTLPHLSGTNAWCPYVCSSFLRLAVDCAFVLVVVLVVAAGILARGAWKSPSHSAVGVALDVGGLYLE